MSNGSLKTNEDMQQTTCQHYWVIEPPNGPTSNGKCQRCGEQREFRNILDVPERLMVPSGPTVPLLDIDVGPVERDDFVTIDG